MLADGHDLAIVQVEVVDKKGKRCPTALNMINFKLSGAGEFIGGIAKGPDNYIGSETIPVECGVNRVFIRSEKEAGTINLKAASDDLKSASKKIETKSTNTEALSDVMPDYNLPSYLKQGPTPSSPSFIVSRIPIEVISAQAASNQEEVALSYDDNEFTEWKNDGNLETGKIEYQLEREAEINQVVMKLQGWRRRNYPIRIYVDDKKVFEGESPRSLGYVTFSFEPTRGDKVRIELIGVTSDKDEFGIVEITGKVDTAGLADESKEAKGNLRIIEIEFYEAVK
jgi:hypothetical protein